MTAIRAVLGAACVAAGLWLLVAVFSEPGETAPARSFTTSRACQECHAEVYAEWESSQHAVSWTNPFVRELSNDFNNQDCIDCHAPRPVFETGIGERVLPRSSRRVEGVDCIACHQLPAGPDGEPGGMAATIDNERAACRPVQTRDLGRPEFCAGCHDQHQTVRQWRGSEWPERGFDCLTCHMPFRGGDPGAGRDHRCRGGDDLQLLKDAVALSGERVGDGWVVVLENVGAGHSFPTDERSRAADLFWRPLPDAAGEPGRWRHLHRMRSPYRHEVDIEDTLLAVHERRRVPLDDDEGRGAVEVALFYKRSPYWEDPEAPDPEREATLVHSVTLAP